MLRVAGRFPRGLKPKPVCCASFSSQSTSDDNDGKNRGLEARGAYRAFMNNAQPSNSSSMGGLWSQMKSDLVERPGRGTDLQKKSKFAASMGVKKAKPKKKVIRTSDGGSDPSTMFQDISSASKEGFVSLYKRACEEWSFRSDYEQPVPFEELPEGIKLGFDTSDMDPVEEFMFLAFVESLKTEDASYSTVLTPKHALHPRRLPTARPMKQLVKALTPQISSVAPDTPGYDIGCNLWNVMSKSPLFDDNKKEYISNLGAAKYNRLLAEIDALDSDEDWLETYQNEVSFQVGFRAGLRFLIEEHEALQGEIKEAVDEVILDEPTNWDVEAVVDEDQL